MTFKYKDSALTACREGISWPPLPRTLALMQREKNTHRMCPWPGQRSGLAFNYSHLSAQLSLTVTSVSPRFAQVESHHHDDLT